MRKQHKQKEEQMDKLEDGMGYKLWFLQTCSVIAVCNDWYDAWKTFFLTQNCDFVTYR